MPPPPIDARFTCPVCGRQYQHSSHLRRHEATHLGSEQGFQCQYCAKLFARRDVWKKHYASCPENNGRHAPPPGKRGKKPRACDACFRSKLSCDGNHPCQRCQSRQQPCTYVRILENGNAVPSPLRPSPPTASSSAQDDTTKIPVAFLLSLTNPQAGSMVEAFLGEPGRDEDAPSILLRPDAETANGFNFIHPVLADDGLFSCWGFGQPNYDIPPEADISRPDGDKRPPSEEIDPILAPLVSHLKDLHASLRAAADPSYDGAFDDALARQVFVPSNRATFVPAYFRHTHRDMPLVHRPSFRPETSAPALVLSVFLCGALYAPPRDCVLSIPAAFFSVAEAYVFRELEARLLAVAGARQTQGQQEQDQEDEQERRRLLHETLQAAVLVHALQFVRNCPAARRRSCAVRRPALVSAVRRLGLTAARHTRASSSGGQEGGEEVPDWGRFVREETGIRIATWMFLADSQQSGVFHVPPLMSVQEMTGDMPCGQELWEADDAASFAAAVASTGRGCWQRTASMRGCVEALMGDGWSGIGSFPLQRVSMLDLHVLIFAIHAMIGTAQLTSLIRSSAPALLRAADRWQELWRATAGRLSDAQLRMSGFVRHSSELCWLAKSLVEYSLSGRDRTSPYFQGIGHESLREAHELLQELRGPPSSG